MHDVIIIGAGPAGISAAVYCARKRLNVLVLTETIGGQAAASASIENYAGFQIITGPQLAEKFDAHLRERPAKASASPRLRPSTRAGR